MNKFLLVAGLMLALLTLGFAAANAGPASGTGPMIIDGQSVALPMR